MGVPEELGRTARIAVGSWRGTVRLCLLLLFAAVAGGMCLALIDRLGR
jgi:hypothetical protein